MALVAMDFNGKSVPEKISKARPFIGKLTGNPDFPQPNPPIAELAQCTDILEISYNEARDGSKIKKQEMKEAEEKLDACISVLGAYIQTTSLGNEAKILSTGAATRKESAPIGALTAPIDVLANIGNNEGTIEVRWKKVTGAKSYVVEMANDLAATTWAYAGACTATKFVVTGLTSGKKYAFRVAALGAAGLSPQSDPAICMAT